MFRHHRNLLGKLRALGVTSYWDPRYGYTCEPYQDAAYDGVNILVAGSVTPPGDGNMENAGVPPWVGYSATTITKEAGTPHGGLQCLRIVKAGALSYAQQTSGVHVVNARYRIGLWMRREAGAVGGGSCGTATGSDIGTFTVGAAWGEDTFYNYKANATSLFISYTGWDGKYGEIDDVKVVRVPIVTGSDNLITGGVALTQPGAVAARPTYLNTAAALAQGLTCPCWQLDGVGQRFEGAVPPAAITTCIWVYRVGNAATMAPFGSYATGPTRYGHVNAVAGGAWFFAVGTTVAAAVPTSPVGAWQFIALGWNAAGAARYAVDGTVVDFAYAGTPSPIVAEVGALMANATPSFFWPGYITGVAIAPSLLTADQIQAIRAITRPQGV